MLNKVTPRLHRFAAARFSPEGEFGLHLTLGVAMLLAAMAVFARLAGAVVAGAPITQSEVLLLVTHMHSTPGMLALTAIAGIWLLRRGHRYWIVALIASVPGGMLLNVALKHTFERARPHFVEPILTLSTYSFPSGHALAATVFYGFLACYAARRARSWPGRVLPFVPAAAMIFTVAFSRLYLGAHYLTDVLAGMLEGCGWLAVCITAAVTFNRRSAARQRRRTGSAPPQEV